MKIANRAVQAIVGMTATMLVIADAAAATCSLAAEQAAIDSRALQSELMVAALSCGQSGQYNAFVTKFGPQLAANGNALRQYFGRAFGANGETQMNAFVTRLANYASTRATTRGTPAFCADSAALFGQVLAAAPNDLVAVAARQPFAGDSGITPCAVQTAGEQPR
ncbi:MAG: hypothetical protein WCF16_04405 [Alphaproteobacteria bacterium]